MSFIFDIIKGMLIGVANIIPGVSGGTMMVSMGVYEKIIGVVNNLFKDIKKSIVTLLPLGIGMLLGIAVFAFVVTWGLDVYPLPTCLCFIGLIMGGLPAIIKPAKESLHKEGKSISVPHIIAFVFFFALAVGMAAMNETQTASASFDLNAGFMFAIFLVGVVAAATMVIPGVSGSLVLMILGYYDGIMEAIKGFISAVFAFDWTQIFYYVGVLAPFGIGVIVGIFAVAKLIEFLFAKFPSITYSGILGLIVASPIAIILKMGHNNINAITAIIGVVLLVAGTWFTYWFGKKTEGME